MQQILRRYGTPVTKQRKLPTVCDDDQMESENEIDDDKNDKDYAPESEEEQISGDECSENGRYIIEYM